MSSEHQEKHPGDIVGRSKQGAVLHASCQQYLYHRPHAGRMSGQCRSDLVSDSWTWGEVKFIMATLNLNRRCNPFIRWKYLFYYSYSSSFTHIASVTQFFQPSIDCITRSSSRSKQRYTIQKTSSDSTSTTTTSCFHFHIWYRIQFEWPRPPISVSKTRSPLLLGLGGLCGSFSNILPKWVVRSLSSKVWICYLKIFYL